MYSRYNVHPTRWKTIDRKETFVRSLIAGIESILKNSEMKTKDNVSCTIDLNKISKRI